MFYLNIFVVKNVFSLKKIWTIKNGLFYNEVIKVFLFFLEVIIINNDFPNKFYFTLFNLKIIYVQ